MVEVAIGILPIALLIALWYCARGLRVRTADRCCRRRPRCSRACSSCSAIRNSCRHRAVTLFRLFSGFSIAVVIGVALGIAAAGSRPVAVAAHGRWSACSRRCRRSRSIPRSMLILGFDHSSKIALVVADAVFPILLATYQGAMAVEPKLVWSARAAGTSQRVACSTWC